MKVVLGRNERRKWARLPLAIPVFVRSRDGKGKEFLEFATALNVSAGGMLVAIRRALPAIAQIRLEIPSAPGCGISSVARSLADPARQGATHHPRRRILSVGLEVCASLAAIGQCDRAGAEKSLQQCENVCASPARKVLLLRPLPGYQEMPVRLFGKLILLN